MGPCSETISRPKPGDTTGAKLGPRSEPKFLATKLQGLPKGSSRSMDGHAPNTIRICNNRNVDKSRSGKTNESRDHMETVTTENEVYKSDKTEKEKYLETLSFARTLLLVPDLKFTSTWTYSVISKLHLLRELNLGVEGSLSNH